LGQYEIRSRIGSGGMGDVYDAMHTALNRRVAIKTLRRRFLDDETVVQRFLREGQLASRIRHPSIVDVTDVGVIGGLPCLVMEHLEGEPLGHLLKREGAMPIMTLVDLLLPIVGAVDYAHERGVLHRDIKPSNIFLARSWNGDITPKVLDFGISKLIDESQQNGLTTDSAFVGTPHYASPELMRADRSADGRSDQYSMGVVFYEGSTGMKPFHAKGGNFVALAMAICAAEFPPPRKVKPDLPTSFEQVILKAMALRPEDRYPSMRALGEALLPFASERARMIWTPTFAGAGAAGPGSTRVNAATPQDGTQVILRPNTHSTGIPVVGVGALGRTGPPSGYASLPPGTGTNPSGVVALSGVHQSATPQPGVYDRTPSYAIGNGYFPGAQPPKKSSVVSTAMVVGFLIATLAIIAVMIAKWNKPAPTPTTEGPPAAASTAQPAAYALALRVTPDNASIELDGVPVGTGKLDRSLPRDGRKHVLRVSAPGYTDSFSEFDDAHPPPSNIALRPAAAAVTPPGSTKPVVHGNPTGGPGAGGKGTGKNPTDRPRTDNIDPWE
jgi:serine/threonine protein kinase